MAPVVLMDEEIGPEPSGSQSDRKTSLSVNNNPDVLSVNQLLESVRLIFYTLESACSQCYLS